MTDPKDAAYAVTVKSKRIVMSKYDWQWLLELSAYINFIITFNKQICHPVAERHFTDLSDCYKHLNGATARILNSNRVSRLLFSGSDKVGIEKMRSIFFQRGKDSGVPVTQPAGWGGKRYEFKRAKIIKKVNYSAL